MTSAREDFDTAINLLADMLEEKLDGKVEFVSDFEPWTYLRETMPPLADRMEAEATVAGPVRGGVDAREVLDEFMRNDPNNASRMRAYLERLL